MSNPEFDIGTDNLMKVADDHAQFVANLAETREKVLAMLEQAKRNIFEETLIDTGIDPGIGRPIVEVPL
jgi:hypothetical protein